jgi:uncharacterized protein (DUF924 family)
MDAEQFLEFWFGPAGGPVGAAENWWKKDPAFDALLRDRCLDLHQAIIQGKHEAWRKDARSCLAYVVVIDQISRNVFRGKPEAFTQDTLAQSATIDGMRAGFDRTFDPRQKMFFYLPLLHAEDRQLQDQAVIMMATTAEATPEDERRPIMQQVIWGVKHRNIILRFGRFPHRNEILGRPSTPEEIEFLKEPGSSF